MADFFIRNVEFFWTQLHEGQERDNFNKDGKEHSITIKLTDAQKKEAEKADPLLKGKIKKSKPNGDGVDVIDGWCLKINNPLKSSKGVDQTPAKVVDSSNKPIPSSVLIGNGSKGHLQYGSYETGRFIGVRTRGIMVKELVEYNTGFEAEDDGYKAPTGDVKEELPWDTDASDEL